MVNANRLCAAAQPIGRKKAWTSSRSKLEAYAKANGWKLTPSLIRMTPSAAATWTGQAWRP